MSRITKANLEKVLERLNKELNRPLAPYTRKADGTVSANAGCIVLDHAPCYGGYTLYEMCENGGQSNFGYVRGRQSAKVMYEILWGIIYGIKAARECKQ